VLPHAERQMHIVYGGRNCPF